MPDLSSHGVVAVVVKDGKYLLLNDVRDLMYGKWAPPHGRCESTDTSEEDAVKRETIEETGLRIAPIRQLLTQPADTKVKTVSFWYCELEGETEVVLDATESSEYKWCSVDEALALPLYPGTQIFFEKIKNDEIQI